MTQPNQQSLTRLRTVLLAADSSNSVIGEVVDGKTKVITYSAYGEQAVSQHVESRLGFNGQLRETKIGWYLLGNGYRAFNPTLMRFHSPDSWSPFGRGGLNTYMYCAGDPVNRSDPTGHSPLFPGLPLGLRKFVSRVDRFLFGGSGDTGPNRYQAVTNTAKVEAVTGTMRPEKESMLKAFDTLGTIVAGTPGARAHPDSMGLDMGITTQRTYPGYEGGAARDGLTRRSSRPARSQASSRSGGSRTSAVSPAQHLPPTYDEVMPLWNTDTFAASQQPQTYTVNRMAVHREHNFGAAAPYQAPAGAPAPAPALVAEQNQLFQGLAELNTLQREVLHIRAAQAGRGCRIL